MTASSTAPPTPPPAMLETIDPASIAPSPPAPMPRAPRIWPPRPPPRMPTIELPTVPRLNFFIAAPAAFPPTAPLTSWINRLVMSMVSSPCCNAPLFGSGGFAALYAGGPRWQFRPAPLNMPGAHLEFEALEPPHEIPGCRRTLRPPSARRGRRRRSRARPEARVRLPRLPRHRELQERVPEVLRAEARRAAQELHRGRSEGIPGRRALAPDDARLCLDALRPGSRRPRRVLQLGRREAGEQRSGRHAAGEGVRLRRLPRQERLRHDGRVPEPRRPARRLHRAGAERLPARQAQEPD